MSSGVFVDLTPTQDALHSERGIAVYTRGLFAAIEALEPGFVEAFVLDPGAGTPALPSGLEESGRVVAREPGEVQDARLWHIPSPFDTSHDPFRILNPRRVPYVVSLFDIIPLVFDDEYLRLPSARARYLAHVELVRQADRVLCISQAAADEAIERLGLDPRRVAVTGIAVEEHFAEDVPAEAAWERAAADVEGLRADFLMYTGGSDLRKNIAGLMRAYALLPSETRRAHQLCVVCRLDPPTQHHYETMAAELGIADDVLFTGYVESETLAALYRSTELFVFPSFYEGYGLPVAEALVSGAPAVVSDNSSLIDLVPIDAARFDPHDDASIAAAIRRGLEDESLRAELRALSGTIPTTWDGVAEATIAVYRSLLDGSVAAPRRAPRTAVVCEVALLTADERADAEAQVRALAEQGSVVVFEDASNERIAGASSYCHLAAFLVAESIDGPFDDVVFLSGRAAQPGADALRTRLRRGRALALPAPPA
ncbi:glycosyltransferase family 4 protein [Rathayibacter sp. VKM Ac-2856]|uniref:glycosyltransferase family 4 protein n=1 Tax=unclassified Rathayibacter TaxID=2609250 RepID=UPI0015667190|nr:glycosyltransferase family 4 protein [Rathayibacter sp. VKM Ac-2858]NQX20793.1 glycosyltransferase family 4 protein [Rathayibacter sp. VKM Ac-2856]